MSIEYKVRYKDRLYGYSLGAFLIEVAKQLGSLYYGLSRYEYESRLNKARAMLQALVVSIPDEILDQSIDLDKIEKMKRKELLELLHKITNALDRKGLLIRKKVRRVVSDDELLS